MRMRATGEAGPIRSVRGGAQVNRQHARQRGRANAGATIRPPVVSALTIFVIYLLALQVYYVSVPTALTSLLDEALAGALVIFAARGYLASDKVKHIFLLFCVYVFLTCVGNILFRYGGVSQPQAAIVDMILDLKPFLIEAAFFYLFLNSKNIKSEVEGMCIALIVLALANSTLVIYDLFSNGNNLLGHPLGFRNGLYQPVGFQAYQVRSAALTMLGASFALYFALQRRSVIVQVVAIYLAIILFAHQSVKEIVAYFLVLPFFFAGRSGRGSGAFVWIFSLLILAFVITSTPIGSLIIGRVAFFATETGLDTARTLLLVRGFEIAQDHFPFGSGAGTFGSAPSYQFGYSDLYYKYGMNSIYGATRDNPKFLQDAYWGKILGQSGFTGAIAYVMLIYAAFGSAFKLNQLLRIRLALPACSVVLLALITSTASSPFSDDFLGVVLAAFSAYALSMLPSTRQRVTQRANRPGSA